MTRYYIRVVTIILLVMIVSAIVLHRFGQKVTENYVRPRAIREMDELAERLQNRLGEKSLEEAEVELRELESRLNFTARVISLSTFQSELNNASTSDESTLPKIFLRLGKEPFVLEIRPAHGLDKKLEDQEGLYALAGLVVVILIVIGAGYFLVSPLVKRLRAQERTIARIADGDLTARVQVAGNDAVNRLGQRINHMADKIQDLLAGQQHLLQAVSHEMRTPTARIGFALEMLGDARTDDERKRRIDALQDDLQELDKLLDELLTFLRFEEGAQKMNPAAVDLRPLLDAAVERASRLHPDITFAAYAPDAPVITEVSERYYPRVLDNWLYPVLATSRHHVTR